MSDDAPTVRAGRLGATEVERLFRDVDELCTAVAARVREPGAATARGGTVSLAEARAALARGEAVQLRYEHDGIAWADTLQPDGDAVRLVRCRLPSG